MTTRGGSLEYAVVGQELCLDNLVLHTLKSSELGGKHRLRMDV